MVTFNCADCGILWESKVTRKGPRYCKDCAEKRRNQGTGPVQELRKAALAGMNTVSVRELKANPSGVLRLIEEKPDLEIIVTRHGRPCAKLVSVDRRPAIPWSERISLRGTWSHLPDLADEDFEEAKRIWEPRLDL